MAEKKKRRRSMLREKLRDCDINEILFALPVSHLRYLLAIQHVFAPGEGLRLDFSITTKLVPNLLRVI
jgi:hypothetical protein